MDEITHYTIRLQGYLDAITRLSKGKACVTVNKFEVQGNIESSLLDAMSSCNFSVSSKTKINYEQIESFLKNNIYGHLDNLDSDQLGLIDWDLQEYFGLMSSSLSPNNDYQPLLSNGGYELTLNSNNQTIKGLLVIIQNYGIVLMV